MARASALRLRAALEEYVAEHRGSGGNRSTRLLPNADLVKQAEALLGGLGPGQDRNDTPGARSAAAAHGTPGRALASASERAREALGVTSPADAG